MAPPNALWAARTPRTRRESCSRACRPHVPQSAPSNLQPRRCLRQRRSTPGRAWIVARPATPHTRPCPLGGGRLSFTRPEASGSRRGARTRPRVPERRRRAAPVRTRRRHPRPSSPSAPPRLGGGRPPGWPRRRRPAPERMPCPSGREPRGLTQGGAPPRSGRARPPAPGQRAGGRGGCRPRGRPAPAGSRAG